MRTCKLKNLNRNLFFALILFIGIVSRAWMFGSLPPGLNQDEASSGVDAYSLLHFGVDRNNDTFPVLFTSWGSGQNALYAYLTIPFIAIGGLSPLMVRLPMLITGILTLPLVFYIGKRMAGDTFGLLSMLFIAISPWHIILSRWGLESNIFPFIFLVSFICLLKSSNNNYWFILGCFFLAISVYAYGTAYVVVPIMISCASLILIFYKRLCWKTLLLGWFVLVLVAMPIILYVVINTIQLSSIHLGPVTIPRLPSEARYEAMAVVFHSNMLDEIKSNAINSLEILVYQTDHLIWNVFEPYGYFYSYTLPLAIIGVLGLLPLPNSKNNPEKFLFLAWLLACFPVGVLQVTNINRINILFMPLIICMAIPVFWLSKRFKTGTILAICILLMFFFDFTRDYHSEKYRSQANTDFFSGLIPALDFVQQSDKVSPVCVTGNVNMPYIFVLFTEKMNPASYRNNIEYVDSSQPFRQVSKLGRYTFGLENCPLEQNTIYVLASGELPPIYEDFTQKSNLFGNFVVYKGLGE